MFWAIVLGTSLLIVFLWLLSRSWRAPCCNDPLLSDGTCGEIVADDDVNDIDRRDDVDAETQNHGGAHPPNQSEYASEYNGGPPSAAGHAPEYAPEYGYPPYAPTAYPPYPVHPGSYMPPSHIGGEFLPDYASMPHMHRY